MRLKLYSYITSKNMQKIFKQKKGKDFYRNTLEYFEYDPEAYDSNEFMEQYVKEDDEIAFLVACKCNFITS
jgi:hypothetical protein